MAVSNQFNRHFETCRREKEGLDGRNITAQAGRTRGGRRLTLDIGSLASGRDTWSMKWSVCRNLSRIRPKEGRVAGEMIFSGAALLC